MFSKSIRFLWTIAALALAFSAPIDWDFLGAESVASRLDIWDWGQANCKRYSVLIFSIAFLKRPVSLPWNGHSLVSTEKVKAFLKSGTTSRKWSGNTHHMRRFHLEYETNLALLMVGVVWGYIFWGIIDLGVPGGSIEGRQWVLMDIRCGNVRCSKRTRFFVFFFFECLPYSPHQGQIPCEVPAPVCCRWRHYAQDLPTCYVEKVWSWRHLALPTGIKMNTSLSTLNSERADTTTPEIGLDECLPIILEHLNKLFLIDFCLQDVRSVLWWWCLSEEFILLSHYIFNLLHQNEWCHLYCVLASIVFIIFLIWNGSDVFSH